MLFTVVEFFLESAIWVTGKTVGLAYRMFVTPPESAEQKLDRVLLELEQVKARLAQQELLALPPPAPAGAAAAPE